LRLDATVDHLGGNSRLPQGSLVFGNPGISPGDADCLCGSHVDDGTVHFTQRLEGVDQHNNNDNDIIIIIINIIINNNNA
jgi:hypothetical protein